MPFRKLPTRQPHDKGQASKDSARARPRARSRRSVGRERVRPRQPQSLNGSSDDSDAAKNPDQRSTEQVEPDGVQTTERSVEVHSQQLRTVEKIGMQAPTAQDDVGLMQRSFCLLFFFFFVHNWGRCCEKFC